MGVNVQDRGGKFYVSVFHKGRRGGKTFNDREAAKAYRAWMELTLLTDEAKAWGSLDGADTGTGASVTFRDYFKRWMATRTLAHNTVRNYWNIFTLHVDPVIGGMPLKGITYSVVRDLMLSMKQSSLSGDTTRSYFAPVRGCLQEAVREGLLPSNPASRLGLSRTKRDPDSETVRAYTEEEIERILRQTQSRFQADAIVRIGVGAGLRESEICGLQTGDIDLERGSLTVRRQACEGRSRSRSTTRSGRSRSPEARGVAPCRPGGGRGPEPDRTTDALAVHEPGRDQAPVEQHPEVRLVLDGGEVRRAPAVVPLPAPHLRLADAQSGNRPQSGVETAWACGRFCHAQGLRALVR